MATKPLIKNGVRITLKSKSNGKPGRPKGTKKKRLFEETKLGFLLKYETPIEYELIMSSTPKSVFPEPKIKVIEAITLASPNPVFQKINSTDILMITEETNFAVKEQKY